MPVTKPTLDYTVAIPLLFDVHVPFVEGVILAVDPTQTDEAPPVTGRFGIAFITTLPEEGDVHMLALVTVKV